MHLILSDRPPLSSELRLGKSTNHLDAISSVAEKEQELMEEESIMRVLFIWVLEMLDFFKILLHLSYIVLKLLAIFLLTFEHRPILLYPCSHQVLTDRFIDELVIISE